MLSLCALPSHRGPLGRDLFWRQVTHRLPFARQRIQAVRIHVSAAAPWDLRGSSHGQSSLTGCTGTASPSIRTPLCSPPACWRPLGTYHTLAVRAGHDARFVSSDGLRMHLAGGHQGRNKRGLQQARTAKAGGARHGFASGGRMTKLPLARGPCELHEGLEPSPRQRGSRVDHVCIGQSIDSFPCNWTPTAMQQGAGLTMKGKGKLEGQAGQGKQMQGSMAQHTAGWPANPSATHAGFHAAPALYSILFTYLHRPQSNLCRTCILRQLGCVVT